MRTKETRTVFPWVFALSILSSAAALGLERLIGIGWDFHPDSVTYATTSTDVFAAITQDWMQLPNNAYYVISHLLGQNVIAITIMNMILFSLTNSMIYKFIKQRTAYKISILTALLLLLNPYRLHLSTTMLKDTIIIFFAVALIAAPPLIKIPAFLSMFFLRVASPIYLIAITPRKYIKYLFFGVLIATIVFWDSTIARLLEFNDQEMKLREFDKIPTFQEYGIIGSLLRAITWSALAFTGIFALISPALAFFPVAAGSLMTLLFLKRTTGHFTIPIQLMIATSIFGIMVTGFTAYIRYIYPLLVIWPMIAIKKYD